MSDLVELTRQHLNEEPEDLLEQELLNEIISLRTGVIAGFLAKTKQYANKIDAEVRRLKRDANDIRTSNTPEREQKGLADALNTIADLFYLQRKMMMYASLTSASTGVGVDKGTKILQKMQKQQKGRKGQR